MPGGTKLRETLTRGSTLLAAIAIVASTLTVGIPPASASVNASVPYPPSAPDANALVEASLQTVPGVGLTTHIAAGPDGTVYATAPGGVILAVKLDGTVSTLATLGWGIVGLAVDDAGNVWAAAGSWLKKVDPSGTVTSITAPGNLCGVAVDHDGNVYVTREGVPVGSCTRVEEYKTNATWETVVPFSAGLNDATGITVGPAGFLYISETSSGRISRWAGGGLSHYATGLSRPKDIAMAPNGTLYINSGTTETFGIRSDGSAVPVFGSSTAGYNQGASSVTVDRAGNPISARNNFANAQLVRMTQPISAAAGARSATVSWTPPGYDGGSAITSYTATASPGGRTCTVEMASPEVDSCAITGLDPRTSYTFSVTATNSVGTSAASSSSLALNPLIGVPSAPEAPFPQHATSDEAIISDLGNPHGVGVDAEGNTYVADFNSSSLREYHPDGSFDALVSVGCAHGIAVAGPGDVYIADQCGQVQHHHPDGSNSAFGTGIVAPTDVELGAGGVVYISDGVSGGRIVKIESDGTQTDFATGLGQIGAMAFDPTTGSIFVASNQAGNVYKVDSAGTRTTVIGNGEAVFSEGLAVDRYGNVVVGEPSQRRIVAFRPDGSGKSVVNTSEILYPLGLAFDDSGALLAASGPENVVRRFAFGPVVTPGVRSATVSWAAPLDDGGGELTAYDVAATEDPSLGCHYSTFTDSGNQCTVSGLNPRISYHFDVTASNEAGSGPSAHAAAATPLPDLPGAPENVTVTSSGNDARVSWNPPSDDGGADPLGYLVSSSPAGLHCHYKVTTPELDSCLVVGLKLGVSYTFSVHARNEVGVGPESTPSSSYQVGDGRPGAPRGSSGSKGYSKHEVLREPGKWFVAGGYDEDGNVYGFDTTAYSVVRLTPEGTQTAVAVSRELSVSAMAVRPDGTVYLLDRFANRVVVVNNDGSTTTVWEGEMLWSMTLGADGLVYVRDFSGFIWRLNEDGTSTKLDTVVSFWTQFAVSPSGEIYTLTFMGKILREDGSEVGQVSNAVAFGPFLMDHQGRFFLAGFGGSGYLRFDPATGETTPVMPSGDWLIPNVAQLGPQGQLLLSFGGGYANEYSSQVSATPKNHRVEVAWSPPADDGGHPVTSYTVTSSPDGATCRYVVEVDSGFTCTVEGLTNGTAYTFTVTATNEVGEGPPSPPTEMVVPKLLAPNAPSNASAIAGSKSAEVTWTPPTDDGGTTVLSYTATAVQDAEKRCTYVVPTDGSPETDGCSISGLSDGRSYTFTVSATNSVGTSAESAASSSVTPLSLPSEPLGLPDSFAAQAMINDAGWASLSDNSGGTRYGVDLGGLVWDLSDGEQHYISGLPFALRVVMSNDGTAFVSTGSSIYRIELDHTVSKVADLPVVGGSAMVLDGNGDILVATGMDNSILRVTQAGEVSSAIGWANCPTALGLAPNGWIYYASCGDGHTYRVDPADGMSTALPEDLAYPSSLIVGMNSVLYELSPASKKLMAIPLDGSSPQVRDLNLEQPTALWVDHGGSVTIGEGVPLGKMVAASAMPLATAGGRSATVSWLPPLDLGDLAITSYTVTAVEDPTKTCTHDVALGEALSCTISNLEVGSIYSFEVTATNSAGTGPASTTNSITVSASVPSAPRDATAVAGFEQATVSWNPPLDDGGASVTSYDVVSVEDPTKSCSYAVPGDGQPEVDACTVEGLTTGTTYTFSVVANNAVGGSDPATTNAATPQNPPSAPLPVKTQLQWFPQADGVAYDAEGYLYVSSSNNAIVKRFGSDGSETQIGSDYNSPMGLAVDALGNVFVADYFGNRVVEVHPDGTQEDVVTGLSLVRGVSIDPSGLLWVAAGYDVFRLNADGTRTYAKQPDGGTYWPMEVQVAFDGDGTAYAVDYPNHRVVEFSSDLSTSSVLLDGLDGATGIAVDADSNVFVSSGGSVIQRSPDGTLSTYLSGLANPHQLAMSPDGKVVVAAWGSSQVLTKRVDATAGAQSATVRWAPAADDGGSPITSYTATAVEDGTKTCTYNVPQDGSAELDTCTVRGLTAGNTYHFTVVATSAMGDSPDSESSNAAAVYATVPDAVGNAAVTAGDHSATVTWDAPQNDGGSPITSYSVDAWDPIGSEGFGCVAKSSATSCTVRGLTDGDSYLFVVRAHNELGASSPAVAGEAVPVGVPSLPIGPEGSPTRAVPLDAKVDGAKFVAGSPLTNQLYAITSSPPPEFVAPELVALDPVTGETSTIADGPFIAPSALAVGPDGYLYVADCAQGEVEVITPAGNLVKVFSDTGCLSTMAVAPDGTIYGASAGASEITAVSTSGVVSTVGLAPISIKSIKVGLLNSIVVLAEDLSGGDEVLAYNPPIDSYQTLYATSDSYSGMVAGPSGSVLLLDNADGSGSTKLDLSSDFQSLLNPEVIDGSDSWKNSAGTFARNQGYVLHDGVLAALVSAPTAAAGPRSATVTWDYPWANGGSPITRFTVTADPGGKHCAYDASTGTGDSCTVRGLEPGTSYRFTVTATNEVGTSAASASSNAVVAEAAVPSVPLGPALGGSTANLLLASGFSNVHGITMDDQGNAYLADWGHDRVVEVHPDGSKVEVGSGLSGPKGVAIGPDGTIYISDTGNNRVVAIDATGTQTTLVADLHQPTGLAYAGNGYLYIAEEAIGRVSMLDKDGTLVPTLYVSSPEGMAVSPDGWDLYVTSYTGGSLWVIHLAEAWNGTIAMGLDHPWGVAVDGLGQVYVANSGADEILRFSADGNERSVESQGGHALGVGADRGGRVVYQLADNGNLGEIQYGPAAELNGQTVTVTWSPPVDDGGSAITGYEVRDELGAKLCSTKASDAHPYTCSGNPVAGDKRFYVVATNAVGDSPDSLLSKSNTVRDLTVPTPPLGPDYTGFPLDLDPSGVLSAVLGYDGNYYILHGDGTVRQIKGDGRSDTTITTLLPGAESIGVSGDGTIFAVYEDHVTVYPQVGDLVDLPGISGPGQVLGMRGGSALVSDPMNGTVWWVSRSGRVVTYLDNLAMPYAMARDQSGNVYISQPFDGSGSVLKVSPSKSLRTIPDVGPVSQLSVDGLGNLYTVNMDGSYYEILRTGERVNLAHAWGVSEMFPLTQISWFWGDAGELPIVVIPPFDGYEGVAVGIMVAPLASPVDGGLDVSWGSPIDEGGSPIEDYTATAYPGGHSCSYDALAGDTGEHCVIEGLQNNRVYRVEVTARNSTGTSAPSIPSSPARPSGPPSAPTSLKVSRGDGGAVASWKAPSSDGGSPITSYELSAFEEGNPDPVSTSTCEAPSNCVITDLTNGTTYSVSVTATNLAGLTSEASAAVEVTPGTATLKPGAPSSVVAKGMLGALDVSWAAPQSGDAAVSYEATAKDPKGHTSTCTAVAPDTSCSVSGLTAGTAYKATVIATNAAGSSAPSASSASAVVLALPGSPTGVVATPLANSAKVTWVAPASTGFSPLNSYTVTADPGGATCTVVVAGATPTNCTVTDLEPFASYQFSVVATTVAGSSAPSSPSGAITTFDVPSTPEAPLLEVGDGKLRAWASASEESGMQSPTTVVYTAVAADPAGDVAASCSYTDPEAGCVLAELVNGVEYQVTVVASNPGGSSLPSAPANATPIGLPTAPQALAATPSNGAVDLSWEAPVSTGGSDISITGYLVDVSPADGTCAVDLETLTAHCTGLSNGTSYRFSVEATNEAGPSDPSLPVVGTPATTPGAVRKPVAAAGNTSVVVTWQAPTSNGGSDVFSYEVGATPGGATCVVTTTSCTFTGLTNGTAYTFSIRARNEVGLGPSASAKPAAPRSPPTGAPITSPTISRVAVGDATATVFFSRVKGATAYALAPSPGASCSVTLSKGTATCAGLTNGSSYSFRVAALNPKGQGPWSQESDAVVPVGRPSKPRGLAVMARRGIVVASWTAPAQSGGLDLTGYLANVLDSAGRVVGACDVGASARSCRVDGLSTTSSYTVSVAAGNRLGFGQPAVSDGIIPAFAFRVIATPTKTLQVALGTGGAIYRSVDAGSHFTADSSPTLNDLTGVVCRLGGRYCIAVGKSGTLLTWDAPNDGSNGPAIWRQRSVETQVDLSAVRCLATGACVAVGQDGTVLYGEPVTSVVGGKTVPTGAPTEWSIVDVPSAAGHALSNIDCNVGTTAKPLCVVVGDHGFMAIVTPSGTGSNVTSIAVRGLSADLNSVRCVADGICVAVGARGAMVLGVGTDLTKAKSWKALPLGGVKGSVLPSGVDLNAISCPSSDLCVAAGTNGTLIVAEGSAKAPAGSGAWSVVASHTRQSFTAVRCSSLTTCFAVGGGHLFQLTRSSKTNPWVVRQNG